MTHSSRKIEMNEAHLIGQRLAAFFLCRVERLTLADTERGLDLEGEELGAVLDDVLQLLRGLDPGAVGFEDEVPWPEKPLPLYDRVYDNTGHNHLPCLIQSHREPLSQTTHCYYFTGHCLGHNK